MSELQQVFFNIVYCTLQLLFLRELFENISIAKKELDVYANFYLYIYCSFPAFERRDALSFPRTVDVSLDRFALFSIPIPVQGFCLFVADIFNFVIDGMLTNQTGRHF